MFTYRFVQNKVRISFCNKLFLSILTSFPPWPIMPFLYDVWNVKLRQYAKGLVWSRGESTSVKLFFLYVGFQPIFLNRYMSNEKNTFADNSRVEPTIFLMEKLSFSMKLFSGHFMGNPSLRLSEVLCSPNHELNHQLLGRAINCNVTGGLCARCHYK